MPVFTSHLLDTKDLGVHRRIRDERHRQGLTLRQLAGQAGMSEAKLSQIETAKISVDLHELTALARALTVPLITFFPRTRTSSYLIRRGDQVNAERPVQRDLDGIEPGPTKHHNLGRPLAELFVGRHMEPLLAQIVPLDEAELHFIGHDYEEFLFVLHGEVETQVKTNAGLVRERLSAGDCCYFRSCLPHCHRSLRPDPAEVLHVMCALKGAVGEPYTGEYSWSGGRLLYRRNISEDPTKEAADKIALLRRTHGITLAELARDLDIGVRQLAQIERGEKPPDLDLLLRLARRFWRPVEYFFTMALESGPFCFVQRGRDLPAVPARVRRGAGPAGTVYRPLASGFRERGMHPYLIQTASVPVDPGVLHEHYGEEFIYVLDGEVEFVTRVEDREVVEVLRPRDSILFESTLPHQLRGQPHNPLATTSAQLIDVFFSPLGESYLFEDEPAG